jgi:SulP family sulfate permease
MLGKDALAGLIVAIIALPLSIALAIASGVSPEKGLITAIIGGFLVSLLGGSRVQIAGPTGAFVIIVLGIVAKYGFYGLVISTFMAGIIMILMGVFKLGTMIKFIPYPITTGFTSGIAVVIFSTQIRDFFGYRIASTTSHFFSQLKFYFFNLNNINPYAISISLFTVFIILILPKITKKIPGALVAIIFTTVLVKFFNIQVATIATKFGEISSSFPMPVIPSIDFGIIKELFMPAISIAMLGSIESLLSAVVADGMIGANHRSNMELVAQGIANIFSSIFGGIPVTGAIARTAANVENGGRTPVSGMVHAVVLLLIMLLFMPLVKYIPLACLAGILVVVAYNMGEWSYFKDAFRIPKSDATVFFATFILTVVFDLVIAIEVGMILAVFLFMKRMSDVTDFKYLALEETDFYEKLNIKKLEDFSSKVAIYQIQGPFFFGAADKFIKTIKSFKKIPKILILEMSEVPTIDATGYVALDRFYKICKKSGTKLYIYELKSKIYDSLEKYGFIEELGRDRIIKNKKELIKIIEDITLIQ